MEQTVGHAEKADGCSTNQPLSATPASQDYQRVVEVNLSPRPAHLQLNARWRAAGVLGS
jgi:hypothetical protein